MFVESTNQWVTRGET